LPIPYINKTPKYDVQKVGGSELSCIYLEPDNKYICDDDIKFTDQKGRIFRFY